jgi:hypothetical protein
MDVLPRTPALNLSFALNGVDFFLLPAAPRIHKCKISRGKRLDIPILSKIRKEWGSRFGESASERSKLRAGQPASST